MDHASADFTTVYADTYLPQVSDSGVYTLEDPRCGQRGFCGPSPFYQTTPIGCKRDSGPLCGRAAPCGEHDYGRLARSPRALERFGGGYRTLESSPRGAGAYAVSDWDPRPAGFNPSSGPREANLVSVSSAPTGEWAYNARLRRQLAPYLDAPQPHARTQIENPLREGFDGLALPEFSREQWLVVLLIVLLAANLVARLRTTPIAICVHGGAQGAPLTAS